MKIIAPKFLRFLLAIYMGLFFTSCAPKQVSVEEARNIQTHVLSVGINSAMDAVVSALQDRLYMIDNVDSDLNIIMASRSTEKKLANTVVEASQNEMPLWLKITGITIIIAIIGLILFSGDDEDSDDEECRLNSHEHCSHGHHNTHHNHYSHSNSYGGDRTYHYKLNVTLIERDDGRTQVRIIAQGESLNNGDVVKAGTIQDPDFYNRIFDQIDNVIFE
ncbi:MAG: hypothetical protein H8E72_09075 [Candidatus Marinimicrobia bacterium]|nr:hypothetical protein [Candidatus Neomarinimicrobiota bacterium]